MTGKTARDIRTTVGGGRIQYPVLVPQGTPVRFYPAPLGGSWFVDGNFDAIEGCERGSIPRHDAIHYGITIAPEDVTQFAPKGDETRRILLLSSILSPRAVGTRVAVGYIRRH